MRSILGVHWKDWCWSWKSNTLATWYKELTHLKRPWCWERLRAGGERDDRGWSGWIASPTRWTWVWVKSKLRDLMIDREAWRAAVHGVTKTWTRLSYWTALKILNPEYNTFHTYHWGERNVCVGECLTEVPQITEDNEGFGKAKW